MLPLVRSMERVSVSVEGWPDTACMLSKSSRSLSYSLSLSLCHFSCLAAVNFSHTSALAVAQCPQNSCFRLFVLLPTHSFVSVFLLLALRVVFVLLQLQLRVRCRGRVVFTVSGVRTDF